MRPVPPLTVYTEALDRLPVNARGITAACPPWALPGEEVPLHVRIPKAVTPTIRSARIRLDDSLEVRDVINMPGCALQGRTLQAGPLNRDSMSDYDYFGVAVATSAPFEALGAEVPVTVELEYTDGTAGTVAANVRIFRPLLQFGGDMPRRLVIGDGDGQTLRLPVTLRYSGFGDVKLRAECTVHGGVASGGQSILDEALGMAVRGGSNGEDESRASAVQVRPEHVEQTASEPRAAPCAGEGMDGMPDRLGQGGEPAAALPGPGGGPGGRPAAGMHRAVEACVALALSDILRRNVGESLKMEPQGAAGIRLPATRVELRLHYEDLAGNQYDPLCWDYEIDDQRRSPAALDAEIPLVITGVDDSGAFRSVAEMDIGA